ncbi:hypothetical protein BD311DRAFT_743895 [Dichomitus squalens]|uniref:Ser-Thr-rich glycosyl-phosphatidyl-inositol-anchored membrane family-domain-containing protein n=1 Tax=Dichomitus squalens TaxID=114155 RepID=A0A4V2K255_9APHY|nr:hypothetical protein BD311DRAFT_743895 [Dichomitus squalens]
MFAKLSYSSIVFAFVTFFACYLQLVLGAALPAAELQKRDVFTPPVLYPHNGTVWTIGQRHNVTWDVSNPPKQITNKQGLILLRKSGETTPVVLENGFDILLGRIEITVPWVVDGDDYSLVLFGDSGNFSPDFTIQGSGVQF